MIFIEQKCGSRLLGGFGLIEQSIHRFPGEKLIARLHVIAGADLKRGKQARDFGRGYLFQEDGGGFLDGGEFVIDGHVRVTSPRFRLPEVWPTRSGCVRAAPRWFARDEFDEFANAELLLADDLDAEHVTFRIEIEHHEAVFGTEGLGAHNLPFAEADISRRSLGIDLDDRGLDDRDDEPASSSIR